MDNNSACEYDAIILKIENSLSIHNIPSRLYTAIILEIMYGMEVTQMDDYYLHTAELAVNALGTVQVPGRFWVEFMPIFKAIPSWVPGSYFKRYIERFAPEVNKMVDEPFDVVKKNIVCSSSPVLLLK